MSLLDRILGRKPRVSYTLTIDGGQLPDPKPHNFCTHCGQPMVDGYMVMGRGFSRETGQRILRVDRRRLCLSLHKQEWPTRQYDEEGDPKPNRKADEMEKHDGLSSSSLFDSWWLETRDPLEYEEIPDCEMKA